MLVKKVFAVVLVALFATMGTLVAQEKYAVIIGGNMNPGATIPATEQWNGGQGGSLDYGFDEFWNDTYLNWEMLVFDKNYTDENVHVLFNNGFDFTFDGQWERYTAEHHFGYEVVTDYAATESNIQTTFTSLASTITQDDFLYVWVMGHGGTNPFSGGSYFYSYDNHKIYDTQLATWLGNIAAHKKTVFLSFPKSGGFVPELEENGTVVITACGATQGASRADDMTPNGAFTENEVRNNITYNHGEVNYHLTAPLTGQTPDENTSYAGISLSAADVNSDNYITIKEAWDWSSAYESLQFETLVLSDFEGIYNITELEYPTLLYDHLFNGGSFRGLIGISKEGIFQVYQLFEIHDNSNVAILDNAHIQIWDDLVISDSVSITNTASAGMLGSQILSVGQLFL